MSATIELHSTATTVPVARLSARSRVAAYVELTKPRITSLIVLTSAAGFCLGSPGPLNYVLLLHAMIGIALLSTAIGTFPGAMPPFIGWVAARGQVDVGAWVLFAILFLWQFPHFLAIAWMYREDYGRAGIIMLPVVEPDGRVTGQQIIAYTLMLLPISLLPTVLGISGRIYFVAALVLGLLFLLSAVRAALSKSNQHARQLLLASVLYLPLLFGVMVLNR